MPHIILLPYLSPAARIGVGGWTVVPRADLRPEDAVSASIHEAAPKYLELYRLPHEDGGQIVPCGSYLLPPNGRVGDEVTRAQIRPIQLALTAGLLEMNPPLDAPDDGVADYCSTSDNVIPYWHPYNDAGDVVVRYGAMIRQQDIGLRAGSDHARIDHPTELHLPSFGSQIDVEYADALYSVIAAADDKARRISVAITWLDLAWRNSGSVPTSIRVGALRSSFEALLDVGEGVGPGSEAFAQLLKDRSQAKERVYAARDGTEQRSKLSDLRWWFTRFAHLRNAIMHGSSLDAAVYRHDDGRHFLPAAEEYLRRSLRATVADAGFPNLRPLLAQPLGARLAEHRQASEKHLTELLLGTRLDDDDDDGL